MKMCGCAQQNVLATAECVYKLQALLFSATHPSRLKNTCQFSSVIGMLRGSAKSGTFMLYGETVGGWSSAARAPKVASPSFVDHVLQSLSVSEEASGAKCVRR